MKAHLRILFMGMLLAVPVQLQAAASSSPAPESKEKAATVPAPVSTPAPAVDPAPVASIPETREADMQFPIMRTIGGMGLVVFLMLGAFFAVKKYAPRYFNKPVSQRNLKVIETLGMGDRRSISLIEIGSRRYLVGNTPHQINLLATLPDPVSLVSEIEEIPAALKSPNKKSVGAPFKNLFEVEKSKPSIQHAAHPLPNDLRVKMRQLREALERS